jgi:hypothetical protein
VLQPSLEAGASRFKQLEPDRPAGLLLRDSGSRSHELADPDFYDVAASKLAVDGKVEERPVAETPFSVEPEPNSPDLLQSDKLTHLMHRIAEIRIDGR